MVTGAEVWLIRGNDIPQIARSALTDYLCEDERRKANQFRFEKDRDLSLASRILLRHCLSQYVPEIPPSDWELDANEYGRPCLAASHGPLGIDFNLSHTSGMVAVGFCRPRRIGVDVEGAVPGNDFLTLARAHFSPRERRYLDSLSGSEQESAFFQVWTLKESFIKGLGSGLSTPLDEFSLVPGSSNSVEASLANGVHEAVADWSFFSMKLIPSHWLSVALECGATPQPHVILRVGSPLNRWTPSRIPAMSRRDPELRAEGICVGGTGR